MLPNISTTTVHRQGTGHKRCPARARRANVPPLSFPGGGGGSLGQPKIFRCGSLCCCVGDCVVGHRHLYPLYSSQASHALHLTDPIHRGGTGPHQMYWAFRCRYISLLQTALRDRHSRVWAIAQRPVDRKMTPIRDYVTMLRQLGARTSIQLCEYRAPRGGPTLFDEESSDDGIQIHSQQPAVGDELLSRKYIATECTTPIPADGEVPPGSTKCVIGGASSAVRAQCNYLGVWPY